MSVSYSIQDAEKAFAGINYPAVVKHYAKEKNRSLAQLSLLLNKDKDYLSHRVRRKSIDIPLLITLGRHLEINFFESCLSLLPKNIRVTKQEKQLLQQVA